LVLDPADGHIGGAGENPADSFTTAILHFAQVATLNLPGIIAGESIGVVSIALEQLLGANK
jgi:hypothetical protein